MPDFIHKPGNGSLWKNDYKTEEKHPDMKGKMTTDEGVEKQIAGWWKENRNGDKYLSITVQDMFTKDEERVEKEGLEEKTTADEFNKKSDGPNDPGDETDLPF